MRQLLELLLEHFLSLLDSGRFRFADSGAAASFGGEAFIVLESEGMRLRFVRDRSQLFLDFQATAYQDQGEWYSVDVIQQLVTSTEQDSAELDEARLSFVTSNIDNIEARFVESFDSTIMELKKLEHARAKRLFG